MVNKQIRELAEQVKVIMDGDDDLEFFTEKFAELLIKKCGEIVVFGDPRYSAQHNIHVYFGVE